LGKFCAHIGKEFCTERIIVYGDMERNISKVASFCGAGCDDYNMAFAKNHGADVFLSSDMKHHEISGLVSSGTAVIVMTHYASESYGLNKIFEKIKGFPKTHVVSCPTAKAGGFGHFWKSRGAFSYSYSAVC